MKTFLRIMLFFWMTLIIVYAQDRNHRRVIPEKPTTERLCEINKPNADDLQRLNDIESLKLKSKNSDWQMAFRNQQREFYEDGFNARDTRTTINKTLLGNGFLKIEEIYQFWDGSAWVNSDKKSYTYAVNNNMIEFLFQYWDVSNWVNSSKITYTYDVNDNKIEESVQGWDGSNWLNDWKYKYTCDMNNNTIEWLYQDWDGSSWVNHEKLTYSYIPTDVNEFTGEIKTYSLSSNFPNPFNPTTIIKYQIPEMNFVKVKVYDILGNEIETLVNEEKPAGAYEITWSAANLPSGVYCYRIQAEEFMQTREMVLLK